MRFGFLRGLRDSARKISLGLVLNLGLECMKAGITRIVKGRPEEADTPGQGT